MYNITFKFEQKGIEPMVLTELKSNQTLLDIALDNGIELRYDCGGVCACSTCHVYVEQGNECLEEFSNMEEYQINETIHQRTTSRLACQCLLLEGSGDIIVTLQDQTDDNNF